MCPRRGRGRDCAPAALDRALLGGPSTSPLGRPVKLYATAWHRNMLILVGITVVVLQILFCVHLDRSPSEGSWGWFPAFLLNFPASLLTFPMTRLGIPPLIAFVTVGSIWWLFLVWVASWIYWGSGRPAA